MHYCKRLMSILSTSALKSWSIVLLDSLASHAQCRFFLALQPQGLCDHCMHARESALHKFYTIISLFTQYDLHRCDITETVYICRGTHQPPCISRMPALPTPTQSIHAES